MSNGDPGNFTCGQPHFGVTLPVDPCLSRHEHTLHLRIQVDQTKARGEDPPAWFTLLTMVLLGFAAVGIGVTLGAVWDLLFV